MISQLGISILLAAYKSEKLIENVFLKGLKKCAVPIQLIIYDNGGNGDFSFLDNKFLLSPFETKVVVIGDGKNIGLNAALNECAKVAIYDHLFLPHTDMYLLPGWDLSLLKEAKNLAPHSYLFCSRSIEPTKGHTDLHIIKDYGKEWNDFIYEEEKLLNDFKDYKDDGIVCAARMPFFMHKHLWKRMGGVDKNYFSYCTDDDLIQEAYDKGVRRFWMINQSLTYHLQGKSNNQQKVDKDSNKPYEYFISKWKLKYPDIQHPGQYHPRLLPLGTKIK